jgi:hypothetical protein
MPRFIVRKNCEYSLVIENASDQEDALEQSETVDVSVWDTAWSTCEVEEDSATR